MDDDEAVMQFYDSDGKKVKEPASGGRQFLSNDPNRPDAKGRKAPAEDKAVKAPAEDKADAESESKGE